jgi:hypothetical protein
MTEPPKRKRRWFQFSLRTLLIGVTLLAVARAYVGQQVEIVSNRRALLDRIVSKGSWYLSEEGFTSAKMKRTLGGSNLYDPTTGSERVFPAVSWFRHFLGHRGIERIGLPLSDPRIDEIRAAFPEATVAGHSV